LTEYQGNSGLAARERLLEAILVAYNLFIWGMPAETGSGRSWLGRLPWVSSIAIVWPERDGHYEQAFA
jgi:hypothetical protein